MRPLLLAVAATAALLGGCGLLETKPATPQQVIEDCAKKEPRVVCETRAWLIEGYALLVGLNATIKENADARVWSKATVGAYIETSREAREQLDATREFLRVGAIDSAVNRAAISRRLVTELQRKVAATAGR